MLLALINDKIHCHGHRLMTKIDFPESKFSLYFLGYHSEADIPQDKADRVILVF